VSYDLGVDLGTTFVAAAISRDGRTEMCTLGNQSTVSPSIVYLNEQSKLLFGETAERRGMSHPDRVERAFKRRLGDPTPVVLGGLPHPVTALMAAQLRDVIDTVSRVEGAPPERVMLTYPANWGPYRRELFDEVPQLAGLRDYGTLTEPEAAAAYYGASRMLGEGDTLAVYDLGGGTFDATVLRKRDGVVEVVGDPDGIERLGGIDFDDAILQWINYQFGGVLAELDMSQPEAAAAMARLRQECVLAKEALSGDVETTIPVQLPNRHFFAKLTRGEFEGLIRALVESTIGTLVRAVHTARLDVQQLSAVLLVGGSSRIPLIERMIAEEIGRPTVVDAHPKHAVALGAAVAASMRRVPANQASFAGAATGEPPPTVPLPRSAPPPAAPSIPTPNVPMPPPAAPPVNPPSSSRRRRLWAAAAVLLVLAVVGGSAFYLTHRSSDNATTANPAPTVASQAASAPASPSTPASPNPIPTVPLAVAVAKPTTRSTVPLASPPVYVAAAPNGKRLYIADGNPTVSVFDTASGKVTKNITVPGPAQYVSFSLDGRYAYISLWDRKFGSVHAVSIVDTTDNTVKKTVTTRSRPFLAAVTPDGSKLYVPNHDSHTVAVIDTRQMKQIGEINVPPEPHYVSFSVDGSRAYVADHESNQISVVDTATGSIIKNVGVGRSPHAVEQNPKRGLVANVNWEGGTVSAINTNSNTVVGTIKVGTKPLNIHWSTDGKFAYVVNNGSNTVSVISADSMTVTATIPTGQAPTSIAVLPDGTRAYVSNSKSKSLTILDLTS
jgi:YVTN family beta-propeller protein